MIDNLINLQIVEIINKMERPVITFNINDAKKMGISEKTETINIHAIKIYVQLLDFTPIGKYYIHDSTLLNSFE